MNLFSNETEQKWRANLSITDIGNLTKSPFNQSLPFSVTGWTCITLLVCAVGCCTNIIVLLVTWPRPGDKSGMNLLIFHFILVNLLNCLVHYPIRCIMVQARQAGHVAPLAVCYPIQALNGLNWLVVFWADNSLAINRCVALFVPHRYKWYSSTRNNVLQIAGMWILCTIVALNYELGEGIIVVLPYGHCAARGPASAAIITFITMKNIALGIGGLASFLLLVKCAQIYRRNTALGVVGRNDQGSSNVRNRVRLALGLVVTYLFSALITSSNALILTVFPNAFVDNPLANLWTQTLSIAQYVFPACIILFSNTKYMDRLRLVVKRIRPDDYDSSRGQHSAATAKTTGNDSNTKPARDAAIKGGHGNKIDIEQVPVQL